MVFLLGRVDVLSRPRNVVEDEEGLVQEPSEMSG